MPGSDGRRPLDTVADAGVPAGTTELGIDIIKVDRIRDALARFGQRFSARVLTEAERRYVRDRPETMAGRWAAKEAVSKVLGLGVRGIGWREIEIERLPTGQPAVRLRGRAKRRSEQLGMSRIAVSISHEEDYAIAIAYGISYIWGTVGIILIVKYLPRWWGANARAAAKKYEEEFGVKNLDDAGLSGYRPGGLRAYRLENPVGKTQLPTTTWRWLPS